MVTITLCTRQCGVSTRDDENVLKLTVVVAVQIISVSKSYGVIYFQWGDCTVCELHHSEAVTKIKNEC